MPSVGDNAIYPADDRPGDAVAAGAALNVAEHTAADGRLSGAIDKKQNDNRKPVYLSLSIAVTAAST